MTNSMIAEGPKRRMNTYILGLKTSFRGQLIMDQLTKMKINFEIHFGIDGRSKPRTELINDKESLRAQWVLGRDISGPELACYWGHKDIWDKAKSGDAEWNLVLEDDADLIDNPRKLLHILKDIESPTIVILNQCTCSPECQPEDNLSLVPRRIEDVHGTYAYLINRPGVSEAIRMHLKYGIISTVDFPIYWSETISFYTLCGVARHTATPSLITISRDEEKVLKIHSRLSSLMTLTGIRLINGLFLGVPWKVVKTVESARIRNIFSRLRTETHLPLGS